MKHQPHVEGLRAVAVLAVIAYHHRGIDGGFVGVDVFFVISGYLISSVILYEIRDTGSFSLGDFYLRRVRRILPALLATVLATGVFASFFFDPEAFEDLGGQIYSAIFSISNIRFWQQSGYFDTAVATKPLLHTWSLSVEEQFYLIWPIFLFTVTLIVPKRIIAGLTIVGVLSLSMAVYVAKFEVAWLYQQASALFYLTPFRIFEFVIGALGIWIRLPRHWMAQEAGMLTGLLCIVGSAKFLSGDVPYPSYYALLPCAGALSIILSGGATFTGRILTNRVSRFIGRISYSLYLIHWPMIVFFYYLEFRGPRPAEAAILFGVMLLCGTAMYHWIEQPFRRSSRTKAPANSQRRFLAGAVAAAVVVAATGVQISHASGWAWRMPKALTAEEIQAGRSERYSLINRGCSLGDLNGPHCHRDRPMQVLFFGNSHEPDGFNAFASLYGDSPLINFISFGTINGCQPYVVGRITKSDVASKNCAARFDKLDDPTFVKTIDIVVYSAFKGFTSDKAVLWDTLLQMKSLNQNLKIIVFGEYIGILVPCPTLYARMGTYEVCKDPRFVYEVDFHEQNRPDEPEEVREVAYLYIDVMSLLCPQETLASCTVETGGEPFTYDVMHRSLALSIKTGALMSAKYGDDLAKLGFPNLSMARF